VPARSPMTVAVGAAATGGDANTKLSSMLSADKTEVRTVERLTYDKVEFKAHPWRIDGDFASGDPRFDLRMNSAMGEASTEIMIEPNSMTFEDFVAGFTPDSAPGWKVEPSSGTLQRRGGEPQFMEVKYTGSIADKGEKFGTLVVVLPNDNFSWTFKFRCIV